MGRGIVDHLISENAGENTLSTLSLPARVIAYNYAYVSPSSPETELAQMASVYNGLPNIQDANVVFQSLPPDSLEDCAILLRKYKLEEHLGINLIHRHFTLENDDEQVVEVKDSHTNRSVASVFTHGIPNQHLVELYGIDVPEIFTIVPSTVLVRRSGVVPIEYRCLATGIRGELHNMLPNHLEPEFVDEWMAALDALGMNDRIGLSILGEGFELSFEESFSRDRVLVASRSSFSSSVSGVPTVWRVGGSDITPEEHCENCEVKVSDRV
jgi:hypothetical protein